MSPDTLVVKPVSRVEANELEDEVLRIARHRGRQNSALILDDIIEEFPVIVERLKVLWIPHTSEVGRRLRLMVSGEATREDKPDKHAEREHVRLVICWLLLEDLRGNESGRTGRCP